MKEDAIHEHVLLSMSGNVERDGCTIQGVCGKSEGLSNLQDLLVYVLKGISVVAAEGLKAGIKFPEVKDYLYKRTFHDHYKCQLG